MPLGPEYDKQIDCDVADMKNISGGRAGGSITAAQFLQRFIQDGTPWAHLDIAGVAWTTKDKAIVPKGGSGFGVRLLDAFELGRGAWRERGCQNGEIPVVSVSIQQKNR